MKAMPEDLQPAVAQDAEGGVVALAFRDLAVVGLARPARALQAAEGSLLDRVAQMTVAGEAGRDHQLVLARATGDGGLAGTALEPVGGGEHLGVVADLTGHPGGEAITEAGKAQVDLAASEPFTPLRRNLASVATPMSLGSCDGTSRTRARVWEA